MTDDIVHFTSEDRKMLIRLDTKVERLLQDMASLTANFATKQEVLEHQKRIEKLEETNSWIVKTVFGIIITAIMATIFTI